MLLKANISLEWGEPISRPEHRPRHPTRGGCPNRGTNGANGDSGWSRVETLRRHRCVSVHKTKVESQQTNKYRLLISSERYKLDTIVSNKFSGRYL